MSTIPDATIRAYARTVYHEAQKYGFERADELRLINALMDLIADSGANETAADLRPPPQAGARDLQVDALPLRSRRLTIRLASGENDIALLETWMHGPYGEHFMLSCSTAQRHDARSLIMHPANAIGLIELLDGTPIGAVAFLDIDREQRRAELRKLIGAAAERGKGYAEESTLLWIEYGRQQLGLQKIYLSTLQTHLRNIRLNESVGFRIEGVLRNEVLLDGRRHDVLRMGLSFE